MERAPQAAELKASNQAAAERLLDEGIPQRILELHKLHEELQARKGEIDACSSSGIVQPAPPGATGKDVQVDEDFPDPPPYGQASTTTGGSSSSEPGKAAAAASGGGGAGGDAASAAAAAAGCGGAVDDVNPRVFALFKQVKGLVLTLIEDLTVLKLYIRLASPAIVDGSFNSAVQEEILDVISTSRHAGLTVIQVISKYFVERAHYVVKAKRYPLIMDFRKGVEQMDRQQLLSLTESVQGIRNNYLLILDKIQKNRDRLTAAAKGRDRHSSSMVC